MNQATALRKNYKSMIRLIGILSLAVISWMSMAADAQNNQCANRQRYLSEVRDHKHEFLARELAIPQENRREFFELYDARENELMVLDTETRQLERDMRRDTTAGDMQLESALTAIYSQKLKEGEIEMRYARELKRVLTPRQLLQLKDAERRFNRTLMRQHRRMRSANNSSPRR